MALQIYYNAGDDASLALYTVNWEAQTFTTVGAITATSVKFLLFRTGSPGNITVSIREVAAGVPTGADIDSSTGVTDIDGITTESSGDWVEFTFSSPIELNATTIYALCIRGGSGLSNRPNIRYDNGIGGYAGGNRVNSANSGASWTSRTQDSLFEVWGTISAVYAEGTKTITVGGVSLTSDIMAITEGTKIVIAVAVVSLTSESYASQSGYPTPRPSAYDADKYWDETNGVWNTTRLTQPGNWVEYVLAISEEGEIYFRAVV